jgi:flagellin-specific chaperone FliS
MLQIQNNKIDLNETSPELTILQLYEQGIESCKKRNKEKVDHVIHALINSLNFEYKGMANSFYDIYQFTLKMVREGHYDQVLFVLEGLHDAWKKAFVQNKKENEISQSRVV